MANPGAQHEAEMLAQTVYDAGDRKQVNAARKKAARQERRMIDVVGLLMQHQDGREFVWELIEGAKPNGNPVVPGDPYLTYFNLGEQNVGKKLLSWAVAFPELYVKMASESATRK